MAALTDAQRAAVRRYGGWPANFFDEHGELERAMDALTTQPAETVTQIVADLATCATIETEIGSSRNRLKARSVGSIVLNPMEIPQRRKEGARLVYAIFRQLGFGQHGGPVVRANFFEPGASASGVLGFA